MSDEATSANAVELATELTIAWLGNPNTRAASDDVPAFLKTMHDAVLALSKSPEAVTAGEPSAGYTPAVTVRRSLSSPDHIISLIDGKPYKTLRRHLSTYGLNPEQYRERYKLKPDYPIVAPSYSAARRSMAQKIGLGQKGRTSRKTTKAETTPVKPAPRAGRKAKPAVPA